MNVRRARLSLETPSGVEEVNVSISAGSWNVDWGGKRTRVDLAVLPDGRLSLLLEDGRQLCGRVLSDASQKSVLVATCEGTSRVRIEDALTHRLGAAAEADDGSGEEIRALMPGRVLEVRARAGESVVAGEVLLVVEAMKMQNEIRCSRAGRIATVEAEPGQAVDTGAVLVRIEARSRE